jgi:hypothetical protein
MLIFQGLGSRYNPEEQVVQNAETNKTKQVKYNETLDLAKQNSHKDGHNWDDMSMEQQADYIKNACDKLGYDFEDIWRYHLQQMAEKKDAFNKLDANQQNLVQERRRVDDANLAGDAQEEANEAWDNYKDSVPEHA